MEKFSICVVLINKDFKIIFFDEDHAKVDNFPAQPDQNDFQLIHTIEFYKTLKVVKFLIPLKLH